MTVGITLLFSPRYRYAALPAVAYKTVPHGDIYRRRQRIGGLFPTPGIRDGPAFTTLPPQTIGRDQIDVVAAAACPVTVIV